MRGLEPSETWILTPSILEALGQNIDRSASIADYLWQNGIEYYV